MHCDDSARDSLRSGTFIEAGDPDRVSKRVRANTEEEGDEGRWSLEWRLDGKAIIRKEMKKKKKNRKEQKKERKRERRRPRRVYNEIDQ